MDFCLFFCRAELQQTVTWIQTHLEVDPDVSLPKQDVYDEYMWVYSISYWTKHKKALEAVNISLVDKGQSPKIDGV